MKCLVIASQLLLEQFSILPVRIVAGRTVSQSCEHSNTVPNRANTQTVPNVTLRLRRAQAGVLQELAKGEFQIVHDSLKALKGLKRYIGRRGERALAIRFHVLTIQRFNNLRFGQSSVVGCQLPDSALRIRSMALKMTKSE